VPDVAAVARVRGGDAEAFRLLVERHSRPIFRLAYRLTRNEEDADDVVQETFLRAFKKLETFDSRASFGTWIHRIAMNYSYDLMRKRNRATTEELDEAESASPTDVSSTHGADRIILRLGLQDALKKGMQSLSENERTAFVLRHYEGMSIDEIGGVLGTEVNATKNTIFRAVKKLREILDPLVRTT